MTAPAAALAPAAAPKARDEVVLALENITKIYPSVRANDGVSLEVRRGHIHAILGENGAGKSTLMKVIYGVVSPDAGTIRWRGEATAIRSPAHARSLGIGMIFQHFVLFETMTVAENIALAIPGPRKALAARIRDIGERLSLEIDPGGSRPRPLGRRAAARRNHPLPAAGPRPHHHGRADRRAAAEPHPGALRDAATARRRGPRHPLHLPQAGGDPRALPHGDRHAERPDRRHRRPDENVGRRARAADDRAQPAARRAREPGAEGQAGAGGRRPHLPRARPLCRAAGSGVARRAAGRDRRHRRHFRQRAVRADAAPLRRDAALAGRGAAHPAERRGDRRDRPARSKAARHHLRAGGPAGARHGRLPLARHEHAAHRRRHRPRPRAA